jgi:hypothetical protein
MISSHTGFQPLKEVWLGDCYPTSWYENFDTLSQDLLGKITEITKKNLDNFQKKLQELGVMVRRPDFTIRDYYCDYQGRLVKPPITPRDWALVLDDTLYIIPQYENNFTGFESTIQCYRNENQKVQVLDRSIPEAMCFLQFPSTVRVGKDIFVDHPKNDLNRAYFDEVCRNLSKTYRVHVTSTGDHSDGVFCPVRPGHIFSTHYRKCYDQTFPRWQVHWLTDTTVKRKTDGYVGRWWVPGIDLQIYNDNVLKYAKHWVGNFSETVFEVNMLIVDAKNICVIVEDDKICRQLEDLGYQVHVIEFDCRNFWDGGLHCLSVDIYREGTCPDLWPGRGPCGLYFYD